MAAKKGGLTGRTYVLIIGGSVAAFLAYKWYQARQAANASTALAGGTTIPGATESLSGTGASPPASLDQWIQDAISQTQYPQGYTNASLYNDIQAWLNGNCVSSQGYSIIGNLISTLGIPPGYTPPNLSACPPAPGKTGTGSGTGLQSGPGVAKNPAPIPLNNSAVLHSAYDQALAAYQAAVKTGASLNVLQILQEQVDAAQAKYVGTAGSTSARTAYDQALVNYQNAAKAGASQTTLLELERQVKDAQSSYTGVAVP